MSWLGVTARRRRPPRRSTAAMGPHDVRVEDLIVLLSRLPVDARDGGGMPTGTCGRVPAGDLRGASAANVTLLPSATPICATGRIAMSMKRSKQRSTGSGRSRRRRESTSWAKPAEPEPTWAEVESKPEESFLPFALSSRYAKGDLISHPKFGKGLVLGWRAHSNRGSLPGREEEARSRRRELSSVRPRVSRRR